MDLINVGNRIVNLWIYPIEDGYVMIDTGYENGFVVFLKNLAKLNIRPESIKYVFLTHAHDDHAGFLNQLLATYPDIRVILNTNALPILYRGQNSFGGGCTSRVSLSFCLFMKLLGKGAHRFPSMEHRFEERCIIVSDLNRKEVEKTLRGRIIDTPGHTSDSISLLLNNGFLFCGDAAMNGFPSIHKITIWLEDKAGFIGSWKRIIELQPKMIYPGHGIPFEYSALKENLSYVNKMELYPLTPIK